MNVLLLENIHENAVKQFERYNYKVISYGKTMDSEKLIQTILSENIKILGIRSRTQITQTVLQAVSGTLITIGCFCIGTNQIDLDIAEELGIPVFNSPFCNSRSVAELIIAQTINLARRLGDSNTQMHNGIWSKYARGRNEIRGKTLGIIGYGNIGSQVSVLAESMGMNVIFYDPIEKLPLGNAQSKSCMHDVLCDSDFVTLHVPELPETRDLITKNEILQMKPKSYLLNASRGTVINIADLVYSLKNKIINGAYIDVFPSEPKEKNVKDFITPLSGLSNVILSPHIGGATEEAQEGIAIEVSNKLIEYTRRGTTLGSVNFPRVSGGSFLCHRIVNIHRNVHGVLKKINEILSDFNILSQHLSTSDKLGYLIVDVNKKASYEVLQKIRNLDESIRTKILY